MAVAPSRVRPLIAVLSSVPLFVEALRSAFDGIADMQSVSADDVQAHGLVRAFRPDAVIAEGDAIAYVDEELLCIRVDLASRTVSLREGSGWRAVDVELSPEGIRNVTVARIYGGEI